MKKKKWKYDVNLSKKKIHFWRAMSIPIYFFPKYFCDIYW